MRLWIVFLMYTSFLPALAFGQTTSPPSEKQGLDRVWEMLEGKEAPPLASEAPETVDLGKYVAEALARQDSKTTPGDSVTPDAHSSDYSWKKNFFVLLGFFVVAVIACIVPWAIIFQTDKELEHLRAYAKSLETTNNSYQQSVRARENTIFTLESQIRDLRRQIEGEPEEDEEEDDHGLGCDCPRCYNPPD